MPTVTGGKAIYIIFTSGQEGKPNAASIEHEGNIVGSLSRQLATSLHSGFRVLQFSPCASDAFITDIVDTLTVADCVCIPFKSARGVHSSWVAREMRVTHADWVPFVERFLSPDDMQAAADLNIQNVPIGTGGRAVWGGKYVGLD
ncbi:hypothetical protein BDV10DRAFT_155419 [Aspergillus recurvatus]